MYQTSQRNWVTIKVHYRYLRKYLLFYADRDWDLSLRVNGEVSLGPLVGHHHNELNVIMELFTG